jgi:hypothetical protein
MTRPMYVALTLTTGSTGICNYKLYVYYVYMYYKFITGQNILLKPLYYRGMIFSIIDHGIPEKSWIIITFLEILC